MFLVFYLCASSLFQYSFECSWLNRVLLLLLLLLAACCWLLLAAAGCLWLLVAAAAAAAGRDRRRIATLWRERTMTACAQCFVEVPCWLVPATQNIVVIKSCDFQVQKGLGGRGYAFKPRLGLVLASFWVSHSVSCLSHRFPHRHLLFSALLHVWASYGLWCFFICHIVGILASKLPSMAYFGAHVPFNIELPKHTWIMRSHCVLNQNMTCVNVFVILWTSEIDALCNKRDVLPKRAWIMRLHGVLISKNIDLLVLFHSLKPLGWLAFSWCFAHLGW